MNSEKLGKRNSKLNKDIKQVASFLMALILLFMLLVSTESAYAKDETMEDGRTIEVKVAFPIIRGISEVDFYGNYRGYNYQYLQDLEIHNNFDYLFMVGNYQKCVEKLKNGEIDLIGYVDKSQEKSEYLDYPRFYAGTAQCMLLTDEYSTKFSYGDYARMQNARVGIINSSIFEGELKEFMKNRGLNFSIYRYDNEKNIRNDLLLGRLDLVLAGNFDNLNNYKVVAELGSVPFYFAVSKKSPNREAVLNGLEGSMSNLMYNSPDYIGKMSASYQGKAPQRIINFTKKEKKYIKNCDEIVVAYSPDWIPMIFENKNDNKISGCIVDVLKKVSKDTKLKFKYKKYDNYVETMKAVESGEADIIGGFKAETNWAKSHKISLTEPYISLKIIKIHNPNVKNNIVALPKGYYSDYRKAKMVDRKKILYFENTEKCLEAVSLGRAEYTYMNKYAYEVIANNNHYRNMVELDDSDQTLQFCIGVSENKPEVLVDILNKATRSISRDNIDQMLLTESIKAENKGVMQWLRSHPSAIAAIQILIVIVAIVVFFLYRKYERKKDRLLNYSDVAGIWNLGSFQMTVNSKINKARPSEYEENFALVHIDMAKFKYVNDIFGFDTGNAVLALIGSTVLEETQSNEYCASLWADHFVLLLHSEGEAELKERIEKLFQRLQDKIYEQFDYTAVFRGGAYFIRKSDIAEKKDVSILMKYANYALGTIEENYSGKLVCYSENMRGEFSNMRLIYKDMMQTLHLGKFTPYYQAKYNIYTGKLIGAEVLVRWHHPVKGVIPPNVFVPHLERNGMIVEVDFSMFEAACQNLKHCMNQNFYDVVISTNFSRRHLVNRDFVRKLTEISDRYSIPRDRLEIEITESISEYGQELVVQKIKEIRRAGYRVAIDDFGSGYSSISLLQNIKVDIIKLDRQFLLSAGSTNGECKVMESIVKLVKDLGMEVICEGVETKEQVELLANMGCRFAQGYYYHKPSSYDDFFELMKRDA